MLQNLYHNWKKLFLILCNILACAVCLLVISLLTSIPDALFYYLLHGEFKHAISLHDIIVTLAIFIILGIITYYLDYYESRHPKKNPDCAFTCNNKKIMTQYDKIAKKNDKTPEELYQLAVMRENGDGVKQNKYKAIKWYRMSAAQNYLPAQKRLYQLLQEEAQNGNTYAQIELDNIKVNSHPS